jgi:hypothetical protein
MKDKLELLLHIDAPTRKEVLRWCRDYETEVRMLKDQIENNSELTQLKTEAEERAEYKMIYGVVGNVHARIKKHGKCSVFYDGKFKVLGNSGRVQKETSLLVGTYNENFRTEYLIEDLRCTLKDVKANDAHFEMIV